MKIYRFAGQGFAESTDTIFIFDESVCYDIACLMSCYNISDKL